MRTELSFANLSGIETELLAVLAADTQTAKGPRRQTPADAADRRRGGEGSRGRRARRAASTRPAPMRRCCCTRRPGWPPSGLLIVGLGKLAKATVHGVRNAAGTAVRFAKPRGIRELAFALPEKPRTAAAARRCARAAVEGAFVGDFDPDTYRSDRKDQSMQSFTWPLRPMRTRRPWKRVCRGRDRGREPELHPLAGQRAGQQADAHDPGPARRRDGRRRSAWAGRSTPPKSCTS